MKFPLVSLILLKRSLVFPILLFSSISLRWSLRKAFLPLLAILWNSAFKWVYLSFSPLPLASLLFSDIYKTSLDNHFVLLNFFSWVLIIASYTMSWTFIHSSSGTLSNLVPWIYLSFPLYDNNGFYLVIPEMSSDFSYFLQLKSEFYVKKFMTRATVSSQSCFCWLNRASHLLLQRI